jgi:NAD(P)-dependent dehydrogenase (short-subunit alcohol dehydrogenase family)
MTEAAAETHLDGHPRPLEGRAALLTGTSSGIGRATAVAFARAGAAVVLASRSRELDEETAEMARAAGGTAVVVTTDITRVEDVRRAVLATVEAFGRLECAVNNAGRVGSPASTATQDEAEWDATVATNLTGTWLCMKYELQQMLAQGRGGAIVNVASAGGLMAAPGMPAYSASKAGVIGLTRTAAVENAVSAIRINALCPGPVETTMTREMARRGGPSAADMAQFIPVRRVAQPEEIAAAALFLCSDAASFITGAVLPADGGMVAA